jgi:hypothetical protein
MGDNRGAYRISVGRPEERRPLGRPRQTIWIIAIYRKRHRET